MPSFPTIDDIPADSCVLVRLDLNSPIEAGEPQDNRRFERHAVTVGELADAGHRVVCLAHQGRPGRDDFTSLSGHAEILADHVDRDVAFVPDTHGEAATEAIDALAPGEVLLVENTRMCDDELPEASPETKADTEYVRTLAAHVDAYVNDAYSAAHRKHASLVGFPLALPAYAGRVMEAEYEANTAIGRKSFDGPVTMVIGGTKATDVIGVMDALEGTTRPSSASSTSAATRFTSRAIWRTRVPTATAPRYASKPSTRRPTRTSTSAARPSPTTSRASPTRTPSS
jgi:phosphoglycerate kinase